MPKTSQKINHKERHDQAFKQLQGALADIRATEGFKKWLTVRAAFRTFSYHNTLLILAQKPAASRVAGFRKWAEYDRVVMGGEKAIRIYAPIRLLSRDEDGTPLLDDDGKKIKRLGFKLVPVFDIAQTEGAPMPTLEVAELEGNSHSHYWGPLVEKAAELGYSVEIAALGRSAGLCDPRAKKIRIDEELAPNARVKTLIHELAHAHGVWYEAWSRPHAEVIVEAVAYIVGSGIGLPGDLDSVPYIASWAADTTEDLERFLEVIHDVARSIEAAFDKTETSEPDIGEIRAA